MSKKYKLRLSICLEDYLEMATEEKKTEVKATTAAPAAKTEEKAAPAKKEAAAKKPAAKKAAAKKPAAKKPAAKKTAAAKKTVEKKVATAKKNVEKKAAATKKKIAAKKTAAKKAVAAKKPANLIFEFDGQQYSLKDIEKKAAKLSGDVYVVASEKKIFDKDGKAVDL